MWPAAVHNYFTFQSSLPRGSDQLALLVLYHNIYFNPRSLAGATTVAIAAGARIGNFNPRSLAGATYNLPCVSHKALFQSSLPRGSDLKILPSACLCVISILAPSRERPKLEVLHNGKIQISILAPSRERPAAFRSFKQLLVISILAPSRERPFRCRPSPRPIIFQSSLPRGSDSIKTNYFSIHLNQAFFAN